MKVYMFRFLAFFYLAHSLVYGQNTALFDQTWSLYELQIEGTTYIPNQNDFIIFDLGGSNTVGIGNAICDIGYLGEPIVYNGEISFEIEFISISPIGPQCDMYNDPEAFNALIMHASFYTIPPTSAPKNPFVYEILEEDDAIQLHITNENGDGATYQNIPLSLDENDLRYIQLIYQSDESKLFFTGLTTPVHLEIFSISGQSMRSINIQPQEALTLSHLTTGMYLITVRQQSGHQKTFKLLKD